jgi:nicotinamide-nucleotide amidase
VGTAPGFIKELDRRPVICLPGVPRELKYLMEKEVIPWIRRRFGLADHLVTYKILKTAGIGESKVDGIIGDLMGEGKNPEVGLLASMGEIKIRIAAKANNPAEAEAVIRPVEEEIRTRLGDKIFGEDGESLEEVVNRILTGRKFTLTVLETFTGGLITHRLYGLTVSRLKESLIINDRVSLLKRLGRAVGEPGLEDARQLANQIRLERGADVGLAVLGFPEERVGGYALKGLSSAAGEGIDRTFSWQMGGDIATLQTRGAVIGLNTLRLALLHENR